jgi:hypothetical protein
MLNLFNGIFSSLCYSGKSLFIAGNNYFLQLFYLSTGKLGEIALKKSVDALAPGPIFHFAFYRRQVVYHHNCM